MDLVLAYEQGSSTITSARSIVNHVPETCYSRLAGSIGSAEIISRMKPDRVWKSDSPEFSLPCPHARAHVGVT